MRPVASSIKWLLRRFGYHAARLPANRFDAMEDTLLGLGARGFRPRVIIDGGANVGRWAFMAERVFPGARVHMVEPQPGCRAELEAVVASRQGWALHAFALAPPGIDAVALAGTSADSRSEGAWVNPAGVGDLTLPATTLDALFAGRAAPADRALLKLDLEGYEIPALSGAERLLTEVEVVVSEVNFYDVDRAGHTVFGDLLVYLKDRGFTFYDMAKIAARPRDGRPAIGDAVFVRNDSELLRDVGWP